MALSDERKQQCRRYLGYSGRYHQVQTELEQAMNAVNEPYLEADITLVLDQLLAVDKQLIGSATNSYADGVKKRQKFTRAEEVTYAGPQEAAALRSEGRMLVGRLSALFKVPPQADVFGGSPASMGGYMRFG